MKRTMSIILAVVVMTSLASIVVAGGKGKGPKGPKGPGDGTCRAVSYELDSAVSLASRDRDRDRDPDCDGDGPKGNGDCDGTGPKRDGSGDGDCPGFVDENGNGVCDNQE